MNHFYRIKLFRDLKMSGRHKQRVAEFDRFGPFPTYFSREDHLMHILPGQRGVPPHRKAWIYSRELQHLYWSPFLHLSLS